MHSSGPPSSAPHREATLPTRGRVSCPISSAFAPSSPSGRCVAATTMPPSAAMRAPSGRQNAPRMPYPTRRSARRAARPGGGIPAAGRSPRGASVRWTEAEGQMAEAVETDQFQRLADRQGRVAAENPARTEVFRNGQRRLHRVLVAEIMAWRRPATERSRAASKSIPPDAAGSSPATMRSSVDLPEPFGPVTTSASPSPSAKDTPEKTVSPPRSPASLRQSAASAPPLRVSRRPLCAAQQKWQLRV